MWARIYLIPALQAEEDRDQVRRYLADQAREKELLGTQTKVYNSDRQASILDQYRICLTAALQVCPANVRRHTGKGVEVDAEEVGRRNAGPSVHRRAPRRGGTKHYYNNVYPFFGHACAFFYNKIRRATSNLPEPRLVPSRHISSATNSDSGD
jgi:hypothetical protein